MRELQRDVDAKRETSIVFENKRGEKYESSVSSRFMTDYGKRQYAKLMDAERAILDEYNNPYTAMVTLTGSPFAGDGGWLPPADFLEDLLESYQSALQSLRRSLGGREYEYLAVIGFHRNGYPHIHIGVWVDGPVTRGDFTSLIDSHVRNSPVATEAHHDYMDAISVERATSLKRDRDRSLGEGPTSGMASYLAGQLPTVGHELDEAPLQDQMGAAVLWSTNTRSWRPSRGLEAYLTDEETASDDSDSWEFVGLKTGEETHEVSDSDSGGSGVAMVEIDGPPAGWEAD